MKHVFYVIYVLFYTGAVFVTGLFIGQMLERSWEARRQRAEKPAPTPTAVDSVARGTLGAQEEATASVIKRN